MKSDVGCKVTEDLKKDLTVKDNCAVWKFPSYKGREASIHRMV